MRKIYISSFLFLLTILACKTEIYYTDYDIKFKSIDCSNISNLIKEIGDQDAIIRSDGIITEAEDSIDLENLSTACNILDQCKLNELLKLDNSLVSNLLLVIQHEPGNKYKKKYFDIFKELLNKNKLHPQSIAILEDRTLMMDNIPQKYGTQLMDGKLYELESPENVDIRRKKIGLEPLKKYLKENHGIDFEIKQNTN